MAKKTPGNAYSNNPMLHIQKRTVQAGGLYFVNLSEIT